MVLQDDIRRIAADNNIRWDKLCNAKVLVTGATGLIGSLCIKAMLAHDVPVQIFALVRDQKKAEEIFGNSVNYVLGDVRNPIEIDISPDFIIHCASNTKSKLNK